MTLTFLVPSSIGFHFATQHKNTPPERSVCRLIYVQLYLYLGTVPKGENHLLPAAYCDEIHHAVFKLRLADRDWFKYFRQFYNAFL